ncbi:TonB-dependent receptor [Winogradskyella flava]|uniref:TonB-dependent receptor n=1 Tax=Winogradskyella flava TaxID=1884876 RepID=UPI002491D843|nr:TonB-dependent receptor [Winogradskyella flava]
MNKHYILTVCLFLLSLFSFAQDGNVKGVISDEEGLLVPYATITISGTSKGTVSDIEGEFFLLNIPVGKQTLLVRYLGYADQSIEVEVKENETVEIKILLKSQSEQLDGIILTGFSGGQAKALNTQKNKQNITNIVSADQVGKFPDANIGDAVKRIPGITMQVDQGEARNVIVRGLAPQLNSVTLNGSRIPSAEGDNRNIQMDLIPADMIQTIEVNKAVTPDMDGDALGGSVNLVTRTAPEGFRLSATIGSGVNFITDKRILNGTFLLGDRSNNGKFGWMVAASVFDNDFGSDNIEAEWTDEFEFFDGTDVVEADVNPYTNVFEQRTYIVQRVRRSFSANFDYRFNANNKLELRTMYNWRDDRENRYRLEHEILDGEDIEQDDFLIDGSGNLTQFPVEVARQTKAGIDNDRNQNTRLEDQRMQNYTLAGEHLLGELKLDWMVSYAKASEERLNERYAQFNSEYLINNGLDSEFPLFTPVNSADGDDLSGFEFDEITEENQYTEEEDTNLFLNAQLPADFFNQGDGFIKFGLRGRLKNKFRDNNFFEFDLEDQFPALDGLPTRDFSDPDYLAGSQYQTGFFATPEWLGGLDLVDGDPVLDEFLRANYDVKENVFAAYAMASQQMSEKFSILAGLRIENTTIEATGNQIEDEDELVGTITEESNYINVMPSIHLKYGLTDNTIFRFAWTNTLARPNYADLVPTVDIVASDEEIFLGNPELEATTSMAFDLMAEHYFKSVGILSGGVFYKDISDFIYVLQSEDDATGFQIFQPQNGDDATIFGAEISFQRQLDFLPGFLRNLSLYLNYTYLSSSADGVANEDGDFRTDLDLPGTAPNMFNGSLAYNDNKFNIRLSANYSDAYIDEIGGSSFDDRYYDEQFLVDFNVSYAINSNLRIYADLNNITDQPLRFYQGISSRTMQAEYYGRRLTFGLKYDLFKRK